MSQPAPHPPRISRLALIDDAEFDQMLYARLIKRSKLVGETLSFLSAEDAIRYFESPGARPVDAVLLDINMPGMSGFEFLDHMLASGQTEFAGNVVVMLTTSLDPNDIDRARSYDLVRDYINKPLAETHLHRVADLVDAQHARPS